MERFVFKAGCAGTALGFAVLRDVSVSVPVAVEEAEDVKPCWSGTFPWEQLLHAVRAWGLQKVCFEGTLPALWHLMDVQTHPSMVGAVWVDVGNSQGAPKEEPRTKQFLKGTWGLLVSKPLSWALFPSPLAAVMQPPLSTHRVSQESPQVILWLLHCPQLLCGTASPVPSRAWPGLMSPSYRCLWTHNSLVREKEGQTQICDNDK